MKDFLHFNFPRTNFPHLKTSRTSSIGSAILAGITLVTPAFATVTIDYVTISNAGNAADTRVMTDNTTGYGSVSYAYKIAKNETTIAQYAEFLNAVAKTDTYSLYSSSMSTTSHINGISQSGDPGNYTYTVNSGSGNKPITYVSWFDAARFCNWLHNDQQTGEGAALTAETGAYELNGATSGTNFAKNAGATVWIPSEDEWYKAAYYDPSKNDTGGYWPYPTQSDSLGGNTPGVANSANYYDTDYMGYPGAALTDVEAYGTNSDSAYGTNDQGGNVWEWNDATIGSSRGLRGGAWNNSNVVLDSSFRGYDGYGVDSSEGDKIGFRVASIPEPRAMALTIWFSACLVTRRKR